MGRHGETVFNRDGFIMGRTDSFLTSHALIRAREMGPVLAPEGISRIYCSPLGRTAMTASIYSQLLRAPLHFRPEMPELSCGIWEGRVRREIVRNSLWLRKTWEDRPPEGESYRDAEARVGPFVNELLDTLAHESTILVIGHAGVNRVFLKLLLGLHPSRAIAIRCPHELVYIIEDERTVRYRGLGWEDGEGMLREAQ